MNGHTVISPVEFTIEGEENSTLQPVGELTSNMFYTQGEDQYTVTDEVSTGSEEFAKENAHLYALCSNKNVLRDSAIEGLRHINIINVSDTNITNGGIVEVTLKLDGHSDEDAVLTSDLNACSKNELLFAQEFALSDIRSFEVNGASYTLPEYDEDVLNAIDALDAVDFDIVIFDPIAQIGAIVPLATADELGK